MLLPSESNTVHIVTETVAQLQKVLVQNDKIESLTVKGEAIDFDLIALVLQRHHLSLRSLCLNGQNRKSPITEGNAKKLADAIKSCSSLETLSIEYFAQDLSLHLLLFPVVISSLKQLTSLSFCGTFLPEWNVKLFSDLNNVRVLNLTYSMKDAEWNRYLLQMLKNSTLEVLILGDSPIGFYQIENLVNLIVSPHNKIRVLEWTPHSYEENWEMSILLRREILPNPERKIIVTREVVKKTLQHNHFLVFCEKLAACKSYINDRAQRLSKTELVFDIKNETFLGINFIAASIQLHAATLQHLTIRINAVEFETPRILYFENLLKALKECHQLQSLRIENFQGAFSKEQVVQLLDVIKSLNLTFLSFNSTFIGPAAFPQLIDIFRLKKLIKIDLTLCGLVNTYAVLNLSVGLSLATTLNEIILGSSPLTSEWLQILRKAVNVPGRTGTTLDWNLTDEATMIIRMDFMCSAIYQGRHEQYPSFACTFARQISKNKPEEPKANPIPKQVNPSPATFLSRKSTKKDEASEGFELQTFIDDPNERLLKVTPTDYGSRNRPGSKP